MLDEMGRLIAAHSGPDLNSAIPGLLLAQVSVEPDNSDYSIPGPLLVVMVQGAKRLLLGDQTYQYSAGQCLVVTADLPLTGHYIDVSPARPSLALGLVLRPTAVAALLLQQSLPAGSRKPQNSPALATADADIRLLDAATRLLRLLDHPADAAVLAPLIEQEILWRLITGELGGVVRQLGIADSNVAHISRTITWIRENYAEPLRVDDLARLAGMSPSAFHRKFHAVTAMSPLQFHKRIRLQQARSLLLTRSGDIAGVGHEVGYDSPSQFSREYRQLFGSPPGHDAARLRALAQPVGSAAMI